MNICFKEIPCIAVSRGSVVDIYPLANFDNLVVQDISLEFVKWVNSKTPCLIYPKHILKQLYKGVEICDAPNSQYGGRILDELILLYLGGMKQLIDNKIVYMKHTNTYVAFCPICKKYKVFVMSCGLNKKIIDNAYAGLSSAVVCEDCITKNESWDRTQLAQYYAEVLNRDGLLFDICIKVVDDAILTSEEWKFIEREYGRDHELIEIRPKKCDNPIYLVRIPHNDGSHSYEPTITLTRWRICASRPSREYFMCNVDAYDEDSAYEQFNEGNTYNDDYTYEDDNYEPYEIDDCEQE